MKNVNGFIRWYQSVFYCAYYLDLTLCTAERALTFYSRAKMFELSKNTEDLDAKEVACLFVSKFHSCQKLTEDEAHQVIRVLRKHKRIRWIFC